MSKLPLFLVSTILIPACVAPADDDGAIFHGERWLHRVVMDGDHIAVLDGAEASTDPADVGVEVKVIDTRGELLLSDRVEDGARGLALHPEAVATVELTRDTERRVVVRPLDGSPRVLPALEGSPVAIDATAQGFAWIEAQLIRTEEGPIVPLGVFELTLVESDATGTVLGRRVLSPDVPVRAPISLLVILPELGMAVEGDGLWIWTRSLYCGGGSYAYHFDRTTGAGTLAWEGRRAVTGPATGTSCECGDAEGNASDYVLAVGGPVTAPIVVGNVYACASVAASAAFVVEGEARVDIDRRISEVVIDASGVLVGVGAEVLALSEGALVPTGIDVGMALRGLSGNAESIAYATDDGVFVVPR